MARPKKSPSDKMGKPIPIRFSVKDRVRIEEMAKKVRIPVAVFLRNKILDALNHNNL